MQLNFFPFPQLLFVTMTVSVLTNLNYIWQTKQFYRYLECFDLSLHLNYGDLDCAKDIFYC